MEHRPAAAVGGELGFAAHGLALAAAVEAADEETIAPAVLGFPRRQAPAVAHREAVLVEHRESEALVDGPAVADIGPFEFEASGRPGHRAGGAQLTHRKAVRSEASRVGKECGSTC